MIDRALDAMRARAPMRTWSRVLSIPVAIVCAIVLGLAKWLDPSAAGHSTHLQLGLRPCTVLSLTGWPCPMCGATTSFALMADLRVPEALYNQPFAVFLFLLTFAVLGVATAEVVAPRDRWVRILDRIEPWEGWLAGGFLGAMALGWAWKAWLMNG